MFAYVARQAIYDRNKNVFAYELLFRNGVQNCFPDISADEATSSMLAGSHLSVGVETITGNLPAFINFHQDTLLYRFPSTLDPLNVVIEVLETVEVTAELIQACQHIANMGYKIALDDYDFSAKWESLMPFVSYIKLEVEQIDIHNPATLQKIKDLKRDNKILIAEKVETHQEFESLFSLEFDYFQGYFLSKPEVIKHKNIDVSINSVIELVGISVSKDFNLEKINEIFEKDVGLSFKLMRFINNPLFNKRQKIDSLAHALKYLGQIELKKFIALLAIANIKGDKPVDLVTTSLCRAHFCKLLTSEMNLAEDPPYGFILGLFSLLDALLDMPMDRVMQRLPFSDNIKQILCKQDVGGALQLQYELCLAFEKADWNKIDEISEQIDIGIPHLFTLYYDAVKWTNNMKTTF